MHTNIPLQSFVYCQGHSDNTIGSGGELEIKDSCIVSICRCENIFVVDGDGGCEN